jgi:hypothetical protein
MSSGGSSAEKWSVRDSVIRCTPCQRPVGDNPRGRVGSRRLGNAVFNATGIRIRDLPIDPEDLLGASAYSG